MTGPDVEFSSRWLLSIRLPKRRPRALLINRQLSYRTRVIRATTETTLSGEASHVVMVAEVEAFYADCRQWTLSQRHLSTAITARLLYYPGE